MKSLAELTLGSAFRDVLVELHDLLGPCDVAFKAEEVSGEGAASVAAPAAAAGSADAVATATAMHEAVVRDSTAYVHLLYPAGDAAAVVLQPGKAYLVSGERVIHASAMHTVIQPYLSSIALSFPHALLVSS